MGNLRKVEIAVQPRQVQEEAHLVWLEKAADEARRGETVDVTDMSRDELVKLLRRK